MTAIPDVNILVYAVDSRSPFHEPCAEWFANALNGDAPVGFTWHALAGFVRISTNPRIMAAALRAVDAFDYVEAWLAQPPSRIIHPGSQHTGTFRRLVEAVGTRGNLVADAHLAAIAIGHGAEIVSCDTDFARFPGLRWFNPVTGARVTP
jgi:uncharacterized protein